VWGWQRLGSSEGEFAAFRLDSAANVCYPGGEYRLEDHQKRLEHEQSFIEAAKTNEVGKLLQLFSLRGERNLLG